MADYNTQNVGISTKQRVTMLVEFCGSSAAVARRLNMSPNSFSNYKARGTFDAERFAMAFPEISLEWLLRGTGPMLEADAASDIQHALDVLGITEEQWHSLKDNQSPTRENKEPAPAREYITTEPLELHAAESKATSTASSLDMITIPRAVLNALTQQLDVKDAQIEALLSHLSKQK